MKDRLLAWQQHLTRKIGGDISTPEARRAAGWHYAWMDHGVLRLLWRNLHRIGPQVYRSNQPSARQLKALHDKVGLATVLNLRGASEQSFHLFEAETCTALGIRLVDLQLSASRAPTQAQFRDLLEALRTLPRPLLIHCKSGADRTGMAAFVYALMIEHQPYEVARRQLSFRYLHVANSPAGVQDHILRHYEVAMRATGIGFMEWIETEYDPVAIRASFKRWRAGERDL